jgi:hypothetical protein
MRVFISSSPSAYNNIVAKAPNAMAGAPASGGPTAHFTVFCMPNLLPGGATVAAGVLAQCENDCTTISNWFHIAPPNFAVTLVGLSPYVDGTGGAFHPDCANASIYCDVKLNPAIDPRVSLALVVAEEVEVFEAIQGQVWDCGASNGEGLSRVLASALYPALFVPTGPMVGYFTAAAWLDNVRPNWVDATNFTDQDSFSNGCAVLFLNWMNGAPARGGLGVDWGTICRAGAPTLAQTYASIVGTNDGWSRFSNQMNAMFPPGTPSNLATDNPFI